MSKEINRDMDLEDVASEVPAAIGLLTRRGIICIQCGTPLWKTVEEAIRDAGIEEVDQVINEINEQLKIKYC